MFCRNDFTIEFPFEFDHEWTFVLPYNIKITTFIAVLREHEINRPDSILKSNSLPSLKFCTDLDEPLLSWYMLHVGSLVLSCPPIACGADCSSTIFKSWLERRWLEDGLSIEPLLLALQDFTFDAVSSTTSIDKVDDDGFDKLMIGWTCWLAFFVWWRAIFATYKEQIKDRSAHR